MGAVLRGMRNAFRNTIRTLSVTVILAISIGLALIMQLSYKTVQARIENIKSTIGNSVQISPAGAQGFEGGGEPLTNDQVTKVKGLSHVVAVTGTLTDRLTTSTTTTLQSSITPGTLGTRQGRFRQGGGAGRSGDTNAAPITVPIISTAVSDPTTYINGTVTLSDGKLFDASSTDNVAVLGKGLATKNSLVVGGTFTAYAQTFTVVGIYDAGNEFANNGVLMPLATLQNLSDQTNQLNSITAKVDSVENVQSVADAAKAALGTTIDVSTTEDQVKSALEPLENIKNITFYSVIGALAAAAIITLLTMIMIVRERRREIGVLKAIGSNNLGVMTQFVSESLVLTLMASVVGVLFGVAFSNPVLNALVSSNSSAAPSGAGAAVRGAGRFIQVSGQIGGGIGNGLRTLHATVGIDILLYGLAAAVLIAVLGSAIPAYLIAKIKPAEVMRGE